MGPELRFSEALWEKVSRRRPDFDRVVTRFLQSVECWMFEEPELVVDGKVGTAVGTIRGVIVAGGFEFRLRRPECGWWDWDIVDLMPAVEREVAGVRIEDQIVIYKPQDVYRGEVAFVVKRRNYRNMALHLKAPISLAWNKIRQGRDVRRVFWNDDVIFLLTPKRQDIISMTEDEVNELKEALESVDAGCVITDQYELIRIRKMVQKFGEDPTAAKG
jgi:hypothetical protein